MITEIPDGQLCQAFDLLMTLSEKVSEILEDTTKANTSCVCPAYVYMEGSHGKRFLCEYHFGIERSITDHQTPDAWKDICKYLINNINNIKETFPKDNGQSPLLVGKKCTNSDCLADAYVRCIRNNGGTEDYCNFHFRKKYYRYLSNGVLLKDHYTIIDERYRMNISVQEELDSLTML